MRTPPPVTAQGPLARYQQELERIHKADRLRVLRTITGGVGPRFEWNGRTLVNFGSNNYLGLAEHPRVKAAAIRAIEREGVGTSASRLLTGHTAVHDELETALARLKSTEASLVFSTGYQANLGIIPSLVGRGDLILADRDCHASLIDGCRTSRARFRVYRRDRLDQLKTLLSKRPKTGSALIVTDSVFSMEGDLAPLPDLVAFAEQHDALLLVDDAHATGVFGAQGTGSSEHWNLRDRSIIQMGTLSKALGALGGFVAGPKVLVDYFINRARTFIYTTALPSAIAAAALEAIRIVADEPERREQLWANCRTWHDGVRKLGFDTFNSASPIIPLRINSDALAVQVASALAEEGVFASAIRPPTVPVGTARLRTSVLATHSPEDLSLSLSALERVAKHLGVI